MLRDDAVRLDAKARAAGVDSSLRLWEDVPHVWHIFAGLRESREAFADIADFVARVTRR
jgi:acetyl esterase/lipase